MRGAGALLALGLAALAGACRTVETVPAPRADGPAVGLIETPPSPQPPRAMSDAQRRAWFEAQRPKAAESMSQRPYVPRERVIVERPVYREPYYDYEPSWDWWWPVTIDVGWWWGGWGHGHHGHGWGVGLGWHGGGGRRR